MAGDKLTEAEKARRGTARPSRPEYVEIAAPDGDVEPPDDMSPEGAKIWDELAPQAVEMGTLAAVDRFTFAHMCEMAAELRWSWQNGKAAIGPSFVNAYQKLANDFGLSGKRSRTIAQAKKPGGDAGGNKFLRIHDGGRKP